jgi:hypothetical protein
MFASLRRFLARRRFRAVARALPLRLSKKYGSSGVYTSGQVRRVAEDLKLKGALANMAFAVACSPAEFLKAQPSCSFDDYSRLRTEFMRVFSIDKNNFTMLDIRRLYRAPGERWHEIGPSQGIMNSLSDHISGGSDGGGGGHV